MVARAGQDHGARGLVGLGPLQRRAQRRAERHGEGVAARGLVERQHQNGAVALLDHAHGGGIAHSSLSGTRAMKRRRCSAALPYWLASTIAFLRYRPTS